MMQEDNFSNWIGNTAVAPEDIVTPRLRASFAATFGNHLAILPEVAAGLHWCLAPPMVPPEELGVDGHPAKGGFLPPIPLPRRMWAGGSINFLFTLQPGDAVQRCSTIKDVVWKTGSSGRMCFIAVTQDYVTDRGLAIREDQNIVYRDAATGPGLNSTPKRCDKAFHHEKQVKIDAISLFRYSALTFNAHRIHYDPIYAKDVEFYPDLVIHGPLQATLLINFAVQLQGEMPRKFSYRGVAPATGAQALRIGANKENGKYLLSVVTNEGIESMTGVAEW